MPTALARPELFGDFLLVQRISASAMAEVLVAVRLGDRSGRTFVVKRPHLGERPSGRAAQAIQREAEVLESVRASGLVPLEAAGAIAGLPFLAIEHLRAASLDRVLASGALDAGSVRAIARDLGGALAALHDAGWVHRDVAPANVLVDDAGEVRLIDLGLAARAGTRAGEIAGTAGYVAPEAVRRVEVEPAEDVYALGVVLAECALGRPLFAERELADAAARGETLDLQGVDALVPNLAPLVRAALRRDPSARPDARALVDASAAAAVDRADLAGRVERALSSASTKAEPHALTPTAPMPALRTTRVDPAEELPATPKSRPLRALGAGPSSAWRALALTLLVVLAGGAGLVAGRRSLRNRDASVAFASTFPARTTLELDGRPTAPSADGSPQPIEPGQHRLVVALRGERREYSFRVRPGERVVLVPILRGGGASEPPGSRTP